MDVNTHSAHVFFGHDTFFGGPLESSLDTVLNLIEILYSLGGINDKISSSSLGSEAPNLHGVIRVKVVLVTEDNSACLCVLFSGDLIIINALSELIT
jgi:hypothetical protein